MAFPQFGLTDSCSVLRKLVIDSAVATNVYTPAWFTFKFRDHVLWQALALVVTLVVFLTPGVGYCALLTGQSTGGCLCPDICNAASYFNTALMFLLGEPNLAGAADFQQNTSQQPAAFNTCVMAVVTVALVGSLPYAAVLYAYEARKRRDFLVQRGMAQVNEPISPLLPVLGCAPFFMLAALMLGYVLQLLLPAPQAHHIMHTSD